MSNAAERLRTMYTDGRDKALGAWSGSFTTRRAVSVECAAVKPDC